MDIVLSTDSLSAAIKKLNQLTSEGATVMATDLMGLQTFPPPPAAMGDGMNDKQMAVAALQVLNAKGYGVSTSEIARKIGITKMVQGRLRKVMGQLVNTGVVEIQPGGKNTYIIVPEYKGLIDYSDPFKKLKNLPSNYTPNNSTSTDLTDYIHVTDFTAAMTLKDETIATMVGEYTKLKERADSLEEQLSKSGKREIIIKHLDGTKVKLKEKIVPEKFERIMDLVICRRNILLVGPAGCGKTHVAEEIAKAAKLDFEAVSCTAGMSESHLTGRSRPKLTGKDLFLSTGFLKCYEEGGVFLLDEFDAADPNLLLVINTALANGYCSVPNRDLDMTAKKHQDFVCIATANTMGRGATRMYQGRNQLDAATIDRFQIGFVEMDYDLNVEEMLVAAFEKKMEKGGELLFGSDRKYQPVTNKGKKKVDEVIDQIVSKGYDLLETLWYIRDRINAANGLRRLMSTRFIQDAAVMMSMGGWDHYKILEAYFCGWSDEEVAKMI